MGMNGKSFNINPEQLARIAIANVVINPETSPMQILGEAVAFAKHFGTPPMKRFAEVADAAITAEFNRIKVEEEKEATK